MLWTGFPHTRTARAIHRPEMTVQRSVSSQFTGRKLRLSALSIQWCRAYVCRMTTMINEMTELACEGSNQPLTTTPVVGTPGRDYADVLAVGAEPVADGEVRATILGSGDPFVKKGQASASVLIEVGNRERDLFFFDLGSGSLANFTGLRLPVTDTTKVFLTHLHADHVGDLPTLL